MVGIGLPYEPHPKHPLIEFGRALDVCNPKREMPQSAITDHLSGTSAAFILILYPATAQIGSEPGRWLRSKVSMFSNAPLSAKYRRTISTRCASLAPCQSAT